MRFLKNKIVQTVSAIMFIAIIGVVVYISSDTLYPTNPEKIKSVKFKYLLDDNTYMYTYINIENLDITYNDTEFKIKLICERGDY